MDDLISKLKGLAIRRPSKDLDDRVLGLLGVDSASPSVRGRRVSPWWTLAASLLMAALGFLAGATWRGGAASSPSVPPPPARIEVVLERSINPFDYSGTSEEERGGGWNTKVVLGKGSK